MVVYRPSINLLILLYVTWAIKVLPYAHPEDFQELNQANTSPMSYNFGGEENDILLQKTHKQ